MVRRAVGITVLACALMMVSAPAYASGIAVAAHAETGDSDDSEAFVGEVFNGLRPVMSDADGDYWTITVSSPGAYVATWERSDGTWSSPEQALAAINEPIQCHDDVWQQATADNPVSDIDEVEGTGVLTVTTGNDDSISLSLAADTEVSEAYDACDADPQWDWSATPSDPIDDQGLSLVRIPLDVIGPGEHDIFLAPVSRTDCDWHFTYAGARWTTNDCPYELGDVATATVAIPSPDTASFPHLPTAESGSGLDSTALSQAEPQASGVMSTAMALLTGAPWAVGVALGGGLLIGLGTLLAERALDGRGGRLARFVLARADRQRPRDRGDD